MDFVIPDFIDINSRYAMNNNSGYVIVMEKTEDDIYVKCDFKTQKLMFPFGREEYQEMKNWGLTEQEINSVVCPMLGKLAVILSQKELKKSQNK